MAVSKGCCRILYCVEALMSAHGLSPKCRHMGITLPLTIQGRNHTLSKTVQDSFRAGVWTRTSRCSASKKLLICSWMILTSHHHAFHSCTHSYHMYLGILFRWAVSLGLCHILVPHLPWTRTSPTHIPAMSFSCRSYSSCSCSLELQQPGLCKPFVFIL